MFTDLSFPLPNLQRASGKYSVLSNVNDILCFEKEKKKKPTRQAIPPNRCVMLSLCSPISSHFVPFISLRSSSLCHTSVLLQVEQLSFFKQSEIKFVPVHASLQRGCMREEQ